MCNKMTKYKQINKLMNKLDKNLQAVNDTFTELQKLINELIEENDKK